MRKLEFSNRSLKEIRSIVDYLNAKWSERISKQFLNKLNKNLDLIQINPELFPKSENKNSLSKCVVTKQTTIVFNFNKDRISIVSVFDTRQNPNKIKE